MSASTPVPKPTPWPNANSRLLGLAAGLPVDPVDRMAIFKADDFERFTLEWIDGYLQGRYAELQLRAGAGDKGRDIVAWIDSSSVTPRRLDIYQCKHYAEAVGLPDFLPELGKLIFYTHRGDYPVPETYWIVTHKGVTNPLQDLIDEPAKLRDALLAGWNKQVRGKITRKQKVELDQALRDHIDAFPFHAVRVKQPLDLLKEHALTGYHFRVFGKPLIDRPPSRKPPSEVEPMELGYVRQLFDIIGQRHNIPVGCADDLAPLNGARKIFERARLAFYCAEGLRTLARDQMNNEDFFATLLDEFHDGLFMTYQLGYGDGMERMMRTVEQAGLLQLGAHELAALVQSNDRHGICHQLANDGRFTWMSPDA